MLRVVLAGCHGRMGRQVAAYCAPRPDVSIAAGLDKTSRPADGFPVYSELSQCSVPADVLIDFSHPDALSSILSACVRRRIPAVLAVTGYSQQQLEQIRRAARSIPVFRSANLSVGASLLRKLVQQSCAALGDEFDVFITERHHKSKADSPSGTAIMLANSIPQKAEVLSMRAGTTAGEHTVLFAGRNEVLELTHRADSREIYAAGAVRAARFLTTVTRPGLYGMEQMLK